MHHLLKPRLRTWIQASALLAVTATGTACSVHHVEPAHGHAEKVYVCHKGKKTLEVADSALPAHLDHGDRSGPCP